LPNLNHFEVPLILWPRIHPVTRHRPFTQVDVFTAQHYRGNPLAVVLDGRGLSEAQMQCFASWTNLAETTFVLPPSPEAAAQGADYQVRIFTTAYEMPFAGHPTLGTCHAWIQHNAIADDRTEFIQECKVGLVRLQRKGGRLSFAAPALTLKPPLVTTAKRVAAALGLRSTQILAMQHMNNGPTHFGVLVDSIQTVLQLTPDFTALGSVLPHIPATGVGVIAFDNTDQTENSMAMPVPTLITRSNREARAFAAPQASPMSAQLTAATPADAEVRFFFSRGDGVVEDKVTGSFNASIAQWLMAENRAPLSYVAAQGSCLGCEGRIYLEQDANAQVWVGGDAVACVQGQVWL
jgi:PhzF family phenazine biosynthesis protein